MKTGAGLFVILLAAVASLVLLWLTSIPLGIPGEWTWARLDYAPAAFAWGLTLLVIGGGLYAAFAWLADRRLEDASRTETALWLLLLVAVSFGWLTAIQSGAIPGLGLAKAPHVLFYRRTEGYFFQARYEVESVPEFIAGYESLMAERDYLHIGTHPPGLTHLYCELLQVCRSSPRLVACLEQTQPEVVTQTFELLQEQNRLLDQEFTRTDAACLWLAAILTQLMAVLTVVPMFLWMRLSSDRMATWRTIVFWPLVPAVAVFMPKSDVLYPLLAMTAAWLWRSAWFRCRERLSILGLMTALLGSLVLWGGMVLSLAFLTVFALIGVQMVCDVLADGPRGRTRQAWLLHQMTVAVAFLGIALIALGGVLSTFGYYGLNLLTVWQWNFSNHALFYDHNPRNWWKWILVNPLELTLAVGAPIVLLAKWGSLRRLQNLRPWLASPVVPFTVVWALLWLSGKNMGEAARLWIILMPWLTAAAVNAFEGDDDRGSGGRDQTTDRRYERSTVLGRRGWLLVLCLQIVVAGLTTLRVDGFHFTDLLRP
ncbi:MAG: hypothetical protein KDA75_06595 [Planctomycetaceae bacterium]|nr:hypothetical protein [Planctomycetaceae bacterium]